MTSLNINGIWTVIVNFVPYAWYHWLAIGCWKWPIQFLQETSCQSQTIATNNHLFTQHIHYLKARCSKCVTSSNIVQWISHNLNFVLSLHQWVYLSSNITLLCVVILATPVYTFTSRSWTVKQYHLKNTLV